MSTSKPSACATPQNWNATVNRMTAPTFNGCFAHSWTAEILPNRPMILPSRHYVYPAIVEEVERGALEVLVQSNLPGSLPFLATCALGFRDLPRPPASGPAPIRTGSVLSPADMHT